MYVDQKLLKTEVNGDSNSSNSRGSSLVASLGLSRRYKRFCPALGYSSRPCTKYIFSHHTLFQCLCPHRPASWAGSHAGSLVSQYVSLETLLDCGLRIAHSASPSTHQQIQCNPRHTPPPPPTSVRCLLTAPFENFSNFLRRIAFVLASTFLNSLVRSYFAAILPIQVHLYLYTQDLVKSTYRKASLIIR